MFDVLNVARRLVDNLSGVLPITESVLLAISFYTLLSLYSSVYRTLRGNRQARSWMSVPWSLRFRWIEVKGGVVSSRDFDSVFEQCLFGE